ncbi:hypothetical protein FRB99_007693, partial [Tulasnella sp. 403]
MAGNTLLAPNIIGVYLQLALWGLYSCFFFATLWLIRERHAALSPTPLVLIFIYCLTLANLVISMAQGYVGFVGHYTDASTYFMHELTSVSSSVKLFFFFNASIIADGLIVWRLFVIWARNVQVIVVPLVALVIAGIGSVIVLANDVVAAKRQLPDYNHNVAYGWTVAIYLVLLLVNWTVTGLIVGRLCISSRSAKDPLNDGSRYTRIIRVIVESGTLYSVAAGAGMLSYVVGTDVTQTIVSYISPILVGIAPTLVVLQLNLTYVQPGDNKTGIAQTPHSPTAMEAGSMDPRQGRLPSPRCSSGISIMTNTDQSIPSQSRSRKDSTHHRTFGSLDSTVYESSRFGGSIGSNEKFASLVRSRIRQAEARDLPRDRKPSAATTIASASTDRPHVGSSGAQLEKPPPVIRPLSSESMSFISFFSDNESEIGVAITSGDWGQERPEVVEWRPSHRKRRTRTFSLPTSQQTRAMCNRVLPLNIASAYKPPSISP